MKKMNLYAITSVLLGLLILPLEGANGSSPSQNTNASRPNSSRSQVDEEEDEYEILERDEIDDTDVYEIPLGDSEIEDEEEVNQIEGKEVFPLPRAR